LSLRFFAAALLALSEKMLYTLDVADKQWLPLFPCLGARVSGTNELVVYKRLLLSVSVSGAELQGSLEFDMITFCLSPNAGEDITPAIAILNAYASIFVRVSFRTCIIIWLVFIVGPLLLPFPFLLSQLFVCPCPDSLTTKRMRGVI
jgi:hypothetical protein